MSFKIDLKGVKELKETIFDVESKIKQHVQDELQAFGQNTANDAKRLAPVDEGFLRNSISFVVEPLKVSVVVAADYAAYLEFGTRGFAAAYVASLPPDWQTFAAQFKGKGGGDMEEFVKRLTEWVMRKGIGATYNVKSHKRDRVGKQSAKTTAEADAYAIALYILRHGIKPHPFLYPAVEKNRLELIKNLNAL